METFSLAASHQNMLLGLILELIKASKQASRMNEKADSKHIFFQ